MMYHADIPGSIALYSHRELMVAVLVGGASSPTVQVTAEMQKKLFIPSLEGKLATLMGKISHIPLENILLMLGGDRHVILDPANCNLKAIDLLKIGDLVTLGLVDPETRLSIGGGWAIDEVTGPNNATLYLSPGYKGNRTFY